MTTHMSSYLEDLVAGWLRGTNFPAAPASLQLALSTADPGDNGAGLAEPGGSYARQAVTFGAITSNEGPGVGMSNNALIQFTGLGAATITHVAIFDNGGTNLLFYAPVNSVKAVQAGSTFDFAVDDISIVLSGFITQYLGTALLNWVKGSAMPAAPAALALALSKANPLRDHSGFNEVAGSIGYTRQALTLGAPVTNNGVGTTVESDVQIVFGPATSGAWGSVSHGVVFDDAMTPNPLLYFPLSSPKSIAVGEGIGFNATAVSFLIR